MTEDNRSSGSDPIGDFQRWLMRSSARRMGKELKGQARRAFGGGSSDRGDVWEVATSEPVPDEAPECAWCPVCRAARRLRVNGPGLASQVAGAGDALLNVAQDTLAAFEATLSGAGQRPGAGHRPPGGGDRPPGGGDQPGTREPGAAAQSGTGWPDEAVMSRVVTPAPRATAHAEHDHGAAHDHGPEHGHGPEHDHGAAHDHGPEHDHGPVHDGGAADDQGAAPGGPDGRE
jgi:hypothetical protein